MSKDELVIQLIKIIIGIYFIWRLETIIRLLHLQ